MNSTTCLQNACVYKSIELYLNLFSYVNVHALLI